MKLQYILEDVNLTVEEALVEGWHWMMTRGAAIDVYDEVTDDTVENWHTLSVEAQAQYLRQFSLGAKLAMNWRAEARALTLDDPAAREIEARSLEKEYAAVMPDVKLDIHHPRVDWPTRRDFSHCWICFEELSTRDIGTDVDHRPVQTICGHKFGHSCLLAWSRDNQTCPMCRTSFEFTMRYVPSPSELLRSCDRYLRWQIISPHNPLQLPEPHSCFDRLATILSEPPHVVRRHFNRLVIPLDKMEQRMLHMRKYGLFVARDRLDSVLRRDVNRYREMVERQMEELGGREFYSFLCRRRPSV